MWAIFLSGVLMRDFLNFVLGFIGSSTLTDDEFLEFDGLDYGNNLVTYTALKMLLIERDEATETTDKLKFYFLAKGVYGIEDDVVDAPRSNIFIGAAL